MSVAVGHRAGAGRDRLVVAGALVAAAALGAGVAARPAFMVAACGVAAVAALAFLAPVTHLTLLLVATAIVPYDLQNAAAGSGAGLVFSDVLLVTGLVRGGLAVVRMPMAPRQLAAAAVMAVVLVAAVVQFVRGYAAGAPLSLAGYELRALLGWATLIVAIPIVADPLARKRLYRGLVVVGLLLGLWGLAQYLLNIPVIGGGSSGVRQDVNYTEGARSIQGGLFGFPIAFLLALAALTAGERRAPLTRAVLLAVVVLNGISLLLTYQRTFWVAAVVGCLYLVARARRGQRLRAVVLLAIATLIVLPVMSLATPGALAAVQQRFLSLGQYASDNSVRARIVETRAVVRRIREAPWAGSGLGDEVVFGYAWLRVPPFATPYTHNGYLWLAWKLGIPAAILLVALVGAALVARSPGTLGALDARMRHGAQAGLLVSLTVSLTFPAFRALGITTTLGILVALAFADRRTDDLEPARLGS